MAKTKNTKTAPAPSAEGDAGVASEKANARLQHTDELRDQAAVAAPGAAPAKEPVGSVTTRDDATDLGVPMLQGSPDEPVGPEDALGKGPTRGDYRERLGDSGYHPHEGAEPQKPRAEEIGEIEGEKGGVDTA